VSLYKIVCVNSWDSRFDEALFSDLHHTVNTLNSVSGSQVNKLFSHQCIAVIESVRFNGILNIINEPLYIVLVELIEEF
jgi:hypothetical protein